MRYLIVDDNHRDRELLTYVLEGDPELAKIHAVDSAETLTGAMALVDRAEKSFGQYDAILLDLNLPDSHDGYETFAKMHRRVAPVPIVVYSGSNDDDMVDALIKQGAAAYIIKTFGLSGVEVFRTLRKAAMHARHPGGIHTATLLEGVKGLRESVEGAITPEPPTVPEGGTYRMIADPGGAPLETVVSSDAYHRKTLREFAARLASVEHEIGKAVEEARSADDTLRTRVVAVEDVVVKFKDLPPDEQRRMKIRMGGPAAIIGLILPVLAEMLIRYLTNGG